jgi:hypothetical protein
MPNKIIHGYTLKDINSAMRISILLIIFIIGPKIHGQTDSLEKAIFYNKVQTKEISNFEFSIIGKKWNETLKNIPYPDLSVNSEGKLQYSFITDFQDISGEKLFNRILEWLSITYGLIPAYLYSNPEDGKIICSNSVSIDNNTSGTYKLVPYRSGVSHTVKRSRKMDLLFQDRKDPE